MVRDLSLKTRMALAVSFLFVVFSATVAYFSIAYFENKTKKILADQQFLLACTIAHDIDDKLLMLQNALVAASLKVPPDITTDPVNAKRFVDERVTLHALFDTTVFILDSKGTIVAESPALPERRVFNLAFREYFQKTVATGKPVISIPYLSSLPDHRPVVMLTAPVFDRKGELACILCGGMRLLGTNLLSDLQQTKVGANGYIILSTSDNIMIMHPDRSRILKTTAPPGANKLFDKALQGFDGSGETVNSLGTPMLSSFKHLAATNWIVGVNFPVSEAYAAMYRTRQYLVGGIAAGTFAMLVIAWLVMKRLTAPLQEFTRHVAALPGKEGEQKQVPIVSEDEIGTLARAFNDMVTALDMQQEALRKSEKHLAEAQKAAHVGSWEVDVASGKITWSQEMFNVTGRNPHLSEPSYEELMQIIHPDDRQALADCMKAASTEGRAYQLDSRRIAPDGSIRYMSAIGKPIFDDSGNVVRLFGTVMDITERKHAEERIRESEARFRAIFEGARDAVIIADIETGILLDANFQAGKLLGRPKSAIIGTHQTELHPPDMNDQSRKAFEECIRTNGAYPFCLEVMTADNERVPVEINASLIQLNDGKKVILGIFRNITERRRAEEEIQYLNVNLQRRATDLAVANRDLEAFGYSLSHDLKGPLTAIYSAAQTLEDICAEQLDETGRFCVDSICKASERMEELLDAMLLLARISRSELQLEEIDLSELAMEILARLQEQEPTRVVEYVITPGVKVLADERLIKSALENLLGNAWKYTRKRAVAHIEFGMKALHGEKTYFVRDNGIGFEMKNAEIIFLPFNRLYQAKEFEGTGIGLTTVQRIIERHGGKLWGEGEPDQGATFYFTLTDN